MMMTSPSNKEEVNTLPGEQKLTREFILSAAASKVIDNVLKNFPSHLKEDLKQSAYMALFESLERNPIINVSPSAYIRPIINARALTELAELYPCFSINHSILCNLLRSRKGKKAYGSEKTLSRLNKMRCVYFSDIEEALENE